MKEGDKPKGAQKDKEGKPKKQLRFSATKEVSEEDSGPSGAAEEEEDLSEESSPSEDQEESGNDSPGSD